MEVYLDFKIICVCVQNSMLKCFNVNDNRNELFVPSFIH